jgi:hypothetical protein
VVSKIPLLDRAIILIKNYPFKNVLRFRIIMNAVPETGRRIMNLKMKFTQPDYRKNFKW